MKRMVLAAIVLTSAATLAGQSTRVGSPVNPTATDDVLVLRYFTVADNQGYGTIPHKYAHEAQRALAGRADVGVVGRAGGSLSVADDSGARFTVSEVTFNALSILRITPVLGRDFSEADARQRRRVAILSYAAWLARYNRRPDVIGSKLVRVNEDGKPIEEFEVVGILPPGVFASTPELDSDTEVLVLSRERLEDPSARAGAWYAPILRPKPGVSAAQTQSGLDTAIANLETEGRAERGYGLRLESLRHARR